MGTTASTAQQMVSAGAPFEGLQGGGTMDGRHSVSVHSFQTTGLHNSKAKSIIPNKVAPVVITTVPKEGAGTVFLWFTPGAPAVTPYSGPFLLSFPWGDVTSYTKPSLISPQEFSFLSLALCDTLPLITGRYFMVRDVADKMDVLGTVGSCGAPNFRQVRGGLPVFGMGQPSLSGFGQVLQTLQKDGHRYNTEDLRGEPHTVAIRGEDDMHVTEEVYKRPLFLQPTYRYHRLPLPEQGAPLEAQFDAFVSVVRETPSLLLLRDSPGPPPALLFSCQTGVGRTNLGMVLGTLILFHRSGPAPRPEAVSLQTKPLPMEQFQVIQSFLRTVPQGRKMVEEVDRAITACAELHDLKEVVLENQKKLEGIRPESPAQGSSSQHSLRQRTLRSLERYFYLILFNYYLHEQYPLAFALSFSRWLCAHPELYRLPLTLSSVGPVAPGELIAKGSLGMDDLVSPDALSTIREMDVANFRRVPRVPIYGTAQPSAKALGSILAYLTDAKRKLRQVVWVSLREEAVLECDGQTHSLRWPGPPMAPDQLENLETQLKDFDRLLEALRAALTKDPGTGFVFGCLSGQGRTTTAMVVALLAFWHIRGFPEMGEEELVSVPDAKFTKGEFEAKAAKEEQEARRLQLRSLQYLERYVYLILFNAYLHLEKASSWQRPFSTWMREVASKAGVYEILNQLGFSELEDTEAQPFSKLRYRWQEWSRSPEPPTGDSL
ncbi:paladin [Trichechus manatus latirostris]|uniref:Paladin n=1 Tax=Trichechus manatus latirostris TaxID=127582 RepID=A0A2Y9G0A4_TRIMA|nr:paladin [Trichechus manatus latirostris]